MSDGQRQPWHVMEIDAALRSVKSDSKGLTSDEAAKRLAEYGPNELQAQRRVAAWVLFLAQFKNVLIVILLAATLISIVLGEGVEAVAIAVIVLFSVVLGFVQEYRAERALEALQEVAAPLATVVRDGMERRVRARDLVVGDVVTLHAGDKIPADMRILESANLQVSEAVLTGESLPADKHAAAIEDENAPLGDRSNMLFAGTVVTKGRGRGLVVATGMETEFGRIAGMLQGVEVLRTPLQENLDHIGRILARIAIATVVLIVCLGVLRGQPIWEILVFGIALGVAAVPEALPAVVTISLALGVQRMVRRNALVRRLPAVETLGCTSVVCTDKTGTLTRGEMVVRQLYVAGHFVDVSGNGYEPAGTFLQDGREVAPNDAIQMLLQAAVLASDATVVSRDGRWEVVGDPTEGALVVAAAKAGIKRQGLDAQYTRIKEFPFSSDTKRMTTVLKGPHGTSVCSKGAPEVVLDASRKYLTESGEQEFDARARSAALDAAQDMARRGLRVLGVACKHGGEPDDGSDGMTLVGLVGMLDPPRPEVHDAIRKCEQAGIRVVMITGDHPLTAQAIARELGLGESPRVITGVEFDEMTDDVFLEQVREIDVYARVSPAHKLRVVTAWQAGGDIVAMTGDGVNDAPALKKADIGIAMGITGTDVTKEAADVMLLDDNFASIVAAVEEGRRIFGNIRKYLMYLLSSNLGEILIMAAAMVVGLPLPLAAVQILYLNLATDGLPALALAVDPPDAGLMQRPPRNPRRSIFAGHVGILLVAGGVWSAVINLGLFAWALSHGISQDAAMTMTFVCLICVEFFKAYCFRADFGSVFRRPFANAWLNWAILWELALLLLIVYVPLFHDLFRTSRLTLREWLIIVPAAATIVPVLEVVKLVVRRRWGSEL